MLAHIFPFLIATCAATSGQVLAPAPTRASTQASPAASPAIASAQLKISGGVSAVTNIFSRIAKPFEQKTGIKLLWTHKDPNGHGGDQVFMDVDRGVSEAGASGGVWEDWVKLMSEKGYKAEHLSEMKHRVIGIDRIQFMTYKAGPKVLSEGQLKGLLTGKFRNWKDVGGEDLKVLLLIPEGQPNTEKFIKERYLGGQKISQENSKLVLKTTANDELVRMTGATPGAMTFGPLNLVSTEVNVPKHPAVGRPITFIWRGPPSVAITKLLDFIHDEGEKFGVVR